MYYARYRNVKNQVGKQLAHEQMEAEKARSTGGIGFMRGLLSDASASQVVAKKRERAAGVGTFQLTQRVDEDELKGKETGETFLLRDPVSTRASAFSPSAGTPSVPTDRIECGMVSVRPNEKHIELAFYGRELHGACTRAFDLPTLAACRSAIGQSTGDGTTQRVYPHSASVPLLTSGTADHFVHFLPADKRDGVREHRDSGKRDALDDLVPEIRDAATLLFAPTDHPTEWYVFDNEAAASEFGKRRTTSNTTPGNGKPGDYAKIDGVLKTLRANLDAQWHSVRNRLPNPPSHAELSFETRLEEIKTMIANGELVLSITRADYANAGVDPCASFASSGTRYKLGAVTQVNEPKLLQDCTNVGRAGVYGAPQTVDNWTALKDTIKADPGLPEVWVVPMLRPDEKATRDVRMFTDADKAGALGFLDDTEPFGETWARRVCRPVPLVTVRTVPAPNAVAASVQCAMKAMCYTISQRLADVTSVSQMIAPRLQQNPHLRMPQEQFKLIPMLKASNHEKRALAVVGDKRFEALQQALARGAPAPPTDAVLNDGMVPDDVQQAWTSALQAAEDGGDARHILLRFVRYVDTAYPLNAIGPKNKNFRSEPSAAINVRDVLVQYLADPEVRNLVEFYCNDTALIPEKYGSGCSTRRTSTGSEACTWLCGWTVAAARAGAASTRCCRWTSGSACKRWPT